MRKIHESFSKDILKYNNAVEGAQDLVSGERPLRSSVSPARPRRSIGFAARNALIIPELSAPAVAVGTGGVEEKRASTVSRRRRGRRP